MRCRSCEELSAENRRLRAAYEYLRLRMRVHNDEYARERAAMIADGRIELSKNIGQFHDGERA